MNYKKQLESLFASTMGVNTCELQETIGKLVCIHHGSQYLWTTRNNWKACLHPPWESILVNYKKQLESLFASTMGVNTCELQETIGKLVCIHHGIQYLWIGKLVRIHHGSQYLWIGKLVCIHHGSQYLCTTRNNWKACSHPPWESILVYHKKQLESLFASTMGVNTCVPQETIGKLVCIHHGSQYSCTTRNNWKACLHPLWESILVYHKKQLESLFASTMGVNTCVPQETIGKLVCIHHGSQYSCTTRNNWKACLHPLWESILVYHKKQLESLFASTMGVNTCVPQETGQTIIDKEKEICSYMDILTEQIKSKLPTVNYRLKVQLLTLKPYSWPTMKASNCLNTL